MKNILILLFLISSFGVFAQQMNIEGTVVDTTNNTGLEHAKAVLIRIRDSVMVEYQQTNKDGFFKFKPLEIDTFQMIVMHPKFGDREYFFFGGEENKSFILNKIILSEKGNTIDEITIFAYKDPIYFKGDTLVYVADSFATKPNAVVEDLLKKLPGITVDKDGSIKSQGKDIAKVLVDGDEFFGADATIATKNLAAQGVETIQVYEKDNPDAAAGDDKIQVLDLKMKDEAKKGYFGKISFANDFRRFYEGEALMNRFNKKQKISFFFLASNTTRSTLEWRDAYKYGVEVGNAYSYNAETDNWEMNENFVGTDGFPQTLKSGLYYTDELSKKFQISSNYTFTQNNLRTLTESNTQYLFADTSYTARSRNTSELRSNLHELNLNFKIKLDSLTTLEIEPKIKYKESDKGYVNERSFIDQLGNTTRTTENNRSVFQNDVNVKTRIALTRDFKKKDRKLVVFNNFVYDELKANGDLYFTNRYTQLSSFDETIDQQSNERKNILSNVFNATYTEPLGKRLKLEFNYELFNTVNKRGKNTYNADGNQNYTALDSIYSNRFTSNKSQNRVGVSLIFTHKIHTIVVGTKARIVNIDNVNEFSSTTITQNVANLLPLLTYKIKFSQSKQLNFSYRTSSDQPSVERLQPVNDNSNPNNIMIGNPNLLPNYAHNLNMTFNSYKAITGSYVYSGVGYVIRNNDFSTSTSFNPDGSTVLKYINRQMQWGNAYGGAGIPLYKKVVRLDLKFQAYMQKSYSEVNGIENITSIRSAQPGVGISVNSDVVEAMVGAQLDALYNQSRLVTTNAQMSYIQTYRVNFKVFLPWKMAIKSDADYIIYSKRTDGYNLNPLIWNASVEKKFGKLENWIVELQAFDILNKNIKIDRSLTGNYISDSKTTIIAQYFMLKATFKFNSSKIKENDDDGHF